MHFKYWKIVIMKKNKKPICVSQSRDQWERDLFLLNEYFIGDIEPDFVSKIRTRLAGDGIY